MYIILICCITTTKVLIAILVLLSVASRLHIQIAATFYRTVLVLRSNTFRRRLMLVNRGTYRKNTSNLDTK